MRGRWRSTRTAAGSGGCGSEDFFDHGGTESTEGFFTVLTKEGMIGDRTGFHWISLLAADGFADADPNLLIQIAIIVGAVVALIGSLGGIVIMWLTIAEKIKGKKPVQVEQPVRVEKADKPVSREEFEGLRKDVEELDQDLEKMEAKILTAIEGLGKEMRTAVEKALTTDLDGRVQIWDQTNQLRERVAALEAAGRTAAKPR